MVIETNDIGRHFSGIAMLLSKLSSMILRQFNSISSPNPCANDSIISFLFLVFILSFPSQFQLKIFFSLFFLEKAMFSGSVFLKTFEVTFKNSTTGVLGIITQRCIM